MIVAGILWFLPVALCSAEMASVNEGDGTGGIFSWVGNRLGRRWGFAALFYQWFQITVGFVTMAFFVLAALSYLVGWKALEDNPLVMFIGVLVIVWGLTLTQMGGTKLTSIISRVGFVLGILIPALTLMVGMVVYLCNGGATQINLSNFTFGDIIPDFSKLSTLVIFIAVILAFTGVESSGSHIHELRNPKRNYPMAMICLLILAVVFDVLGGMSVALSVDSKTLDEGLNFGIIKAYENIFNELNMSWVVTVVAVLLIFGVLAEISSWIVGPSHGMLETAKDGIIPKTFAKTNKHGVSVLTIVIQAIVVTCWDAILCLSKALSGGTSSVSYLTAIGLTVVIYLAGYILFFIAYLKLAWKEKSLKRSFSLPGGVVGKTIFGGVGLIMTVLALVISFFPPDQLAGQGSSETVYEIILAICFVIAVAIPFVIYGLRKHWDKGPDGTAVEPASGSSSISGPGTADASGAAAQNAAAGAADPGKQSS